MILSSLITPFRIYSEYHDLDKFKKDCDNFCEYELITDKTRLLPFQFHRESSNFPLTKIWMRPVCKDFLTQINTENESKFIDASSWNTTGTNYISQTLAKFVTPLTPGTAQGIYSTYNLTVGKKYRIKIVTLEKKLTPGQLINISVENGLFNSIYNVSSLGTHTFEFVASDALIGIGSNVSGANDYVHVKEFAIYEINDYSAVNNNDYILPENIVEIENIGEEDIISYCGSSFNSSLPCGKYYLIMKSLTNAGNEIFFFSEVITIKNFVPSQSPYVLLEWNNTCDLQNVKYTGLDCNYINRLYIDGPITKPEYPFDEEGTENGNKEFLPSFQKWEKEEFIIVPKAPEFLVDSLTCVRLHDKIKYYKPLRKKQIQVNEVDAVNIESLEYDVEYIFQDCAANVQLKILLEDRLIDTTCCSSIPVIEKVCCNYTVFNTGVYDMDVGFALDFNEDVLEFYKYNYDLDVWELMEDHPLNMIICLSETGKQYYWDGEEFVLVPAIVNLVNTGPGFKVFGNIHPNTVCKIHVNYQGVDYVVPGAYSPPELFAGALALYVDVPMVPAVGQTMYVKIFSYNAYCNYGFSNTMSITFGGGGGGG